MPVIVRFNKPGSGVYHMIVKLGERLQFYRGKARRIPPDKDKIFNTVPIKCITSIREITEVRRPKGLKEGGRKTDGLVTKE